MEKEKINKLMTRLGYEFKNIDLLYEAFTHRSYINEHNRKNLKNNERLEFLGDAVMDLITTEYIFSKYPESTEGDLSKLKSKIISEAVFANIARDLNLGDYLFLSNGEYIGGGKDRNSILGDTFEAMIGAIFKDSDFQTVKDIALNLLRDKIDNLDKIEGILDYKTNLQEITQSKFKKTPTYETISESGPDHNKQFEVQVKIGVEVYGIGVAKSKKMAEKEAAKVAIERLNKEKQND